MLQVGDRLPAVGLSEYVEVEGDGCTVGPNRFDVARQAAGKTIAVFTVPGAFTPTCSARHLPGYVEQADALRRAGVDEIWCISVNDAFVMRAWGREHGAAGKVRMLADGSAEFTQAAGLGVDLSARGMGLRSQRCSLLVKDGVVQSINVEQPGRFEVSDAATLLAQVQRLAG